MLAEHAVVFGTVSFCYCTAELDKLTSGMAIIQVSFLCLQFFLTKDFLTWKVNFYLDVLH
jgi:hypothetical protein